MELKRIHSMALAEYLIDHGCVCVRRVEDILHTGWYNWIFEDTELLENLITQYCSKK